MLNRFLVVLTEDEAVNVNPRNLNVVWVQFTGFHDLFDLGDCDAPCLGTDDVKIVCRLAKDQVACLVRSLKRSSPRLLRRETTLVARPVQQTL